VSAPETPVTDGRDEAQVLAAVRARLPGYLPDWLPAPGTGADALHHVFSAFVGIVGRALDAALPRAQIAFLDAAGESRRPPQAARVVLVWRLTEQSPLDVTLPAGVTVTAQVGAARADEPPSFIATQSISLARARLAAVYSVNALEDRWDDHTSRLTEGFTLFDGADQVEHAIYLGHDHLFKLPTQPRPADDATEATSAPDAKIILHVGLVELEGAVREDLRIKWEYWGDGGWWPLSGAIADLLITDGRVDLRKEGGPPAAERAILGRKSYWIRGTLTEPLVQSGDRAGQLALIDTVRASLDFGRDKLRPDAALVDGRPLDTTAPYLPFGPTPVRGTTFYLGSSEAFGRPGARVRIEVKFALPTVAAETISWQYFDGETWKRLSVSDTTNVLSTGPHPSSADGFVAFVAPDDWQATTIGRDTSHFLRVRLDGDKVFGAGPIFTAPHEFEFAKWIPPLLNSLDISFSQLTDPAAVDHCLIANGAVFEDVTHAARFPQGTFVPFKPLLDEDPAFYLAFDRPLPQGLVSLFVDVPLDPDVDPTDDSSPFIWEYLSTQARGWLDLGVIDQSRGFRVSGLIQFIGPFDHAASDGPGGMLFRIRARLKRGSRLTPRRVNGMWLNAVIATHASRYAGEILGRSTGQPRQLVLFPQGRTPILDGEQIDVREWTGRDRGYEAITEAIVEADRRLVRDPVTGQIIEVWVRWKARPHLFDAGPNDRVYTLERIRGAVRFGDGQRGLIPPAGAPISAAFRTGGGLSGNAPTGSVSEPRAAIPFLQSVTNPRPARGGSDAEALEVTRVRGAERLRHRDRALSPRDFEWLAVEASPSVARARCLPATGPAGPGQRGWVTVVIVPYSADRQPQPDDELVGRVRAYLVARAPATLARRIRVVGPTYQPISVVAEIVPRRPEDATTLEAELRRRLDEFLHSLRGGRDGRGWQVGQPVPLSQVAALIEATPGVDFARDVSLQVEGAIHGDEVPGHPDALPAPGHHEIRLTLRGEAC
jgi:hypothetical protein